MQRKIERFKTKTNPSTKAAIKLRKLLMNRMILMALLLLVQLFFFILFMVNLQSYLTYYFGISIGISVLFLVYLVNLRGKNEFKIAWIVPVLIIPVFGISLYFLYKYNQGGIWLEKKLKRINEYSAEFIPDRKSVKEVWNKNSETADISSYLYKFGNYPAYENQHVEYFSSGEDFFEDLIKELEKAKKYIFLEFFIVEPCQIMDKLLEVLSAKVKSGVNVRILFDSIGSISLSSNLLKNYFSSFGIDSKIWLKFIPVFNTGLNNRDHRKIVCIDGKVAFTGGVNITDEYANIYSKRFDYWKDAGIKICGHAAETFSLMFLQLWNVQNKKKESYDDFSKFISKGKVLNDAKKNSNCEVVIPYGDDAYNNKDIAEDVYHYLLIKARKKVCIMTPYMIIDNSMLDDLIFASDRGVDVQVIVPQNYDHFISYCVGRTYIKTLVENGIKVFAYKNGFIHSKVFLSDGCRGTVGSVNMDYRSFYHHFECGVFMYKGKAITDAEHDFENTKKDCIEITSEVYKKIPWYIKVVGYLFRVFAPLM